MFCRCTSRLVGYANRAIHTDGNYYYWESNTLGSIIDGLLVNWQFVLSEPSSVVGNVRKYKSPWIPVPSLDQNFRIYSDSAYSTPELAYTATRIYFEDMAAQIEITDICQVRYVKGIITGSVRRESTILDPEGSFDTPTADATSPLWTAEHVYSTEQPGDSCGNVMLGYTGYSVDLTYALLGYDWPSPIGPDVGGDAFIAAVANDSALDCHGF